MKHQQFLPALALAVSIMMVGLSWLLPLSALAQTNSPETSTSAELRQAIKERIEETIKENNNTTERSYYGYIGEITQISTATFGLMTPQGEEKTIQISGDTALLSADKDISLTDLIIGSGVTVMGQPVDELVIAAKRVLARTDNFTENREVKLGSLVSITTSEITLQDRQTQQSMTWSFTRQTVFEDANGQKIAVTNLEEDQAALIITDLDNNDERYIKRVRLLVEVAE
jgi:hypothetical protein